MLYPSEIELTATEELSSETPITSVSPIAFGVYWTNPLFPLKLCEHTGVPTGVIVPAATEGENVAVSVHALAGIANVMIAPVPLAQPDHVTWKPDAGTADSVIDVP